MRVPNKASRITLGEWLRLMTAIGCADDPMVFKRQPTCPRELVHLMGEGVWVGTTRVKFYGRGGWRTSTLVTMLKDRLDTCRK